jgi:hypothetical protein
MTAFQSIDAFAELYYTMQAIKFVVGVTPTCWRPPYGDVDDRIRSIANALNLRTIIWQFDSNDWKAGTGNITNATVDSNYMNLAAMAKNGTFSTAGTIMLTHELNNFTMQEAINFYPLLKSSFKDMVPIGVARNISQPYVETDYSLPSFEEYISGTTTGSSPATTPTPSMAPLPTTLYTTTTGTSASTSTPGSNSKSGARSDNANTGALLSAALWAVIGAFLCVT